MLSTIRGRIAALNLNFSGLVQSTCAQRRIPAKDGRCGGGEKFEEALEERWTDIGQPLLCPHKPAVCGKNSKSCSVVRLSLS